jgi:serine phosphatase RsbU (regulator of sigma subunit)/ligand-binding sensor domain-containing protein
MRKIALFFLLWALLAEAWGQTYKMKKFHEKHGLPNRFVTAIEQDPQGYLWVGTGDGIYYFDGFDFISALPNSTQIAVSTCFKQDNGTIWFGLNDGRIFKSTNQKCTEVNYSRVDASKINQITEDAQHNIWLLSQDRGIFKLDNAENATHYAKGLEEFTLYSIAPLTENQMLVGTDLGLIHVSIDSQNMLTYEWNESIVETKITAISKADDHYVISTEDQGIYVWRSSDGYLETVQVDGRDLSSLQINDLHIQSKNQWQLSTNNAGLVGIHKDEHTSQYIIQTYGQQLDIGYRSIKTSYTDREHNIWIGTIGEGLAMIIDNAISTHLFNREGLSNNCQAICTQGNTLFRADSNKIFICDKTPTNVLTEIRIGNAEEANIVTTLFADELQTLWIGTQSNGLWTYNMANHKLQKFSLSDDILNNQINDLSGFDQHLYVATEFGIFHIHNHVLLKNVISMQSGLAHNAVRSLFRDSQGRIWLASTHNQVTYIADGIIQNIPTPFNGALIEITCFAEDEHKNIWAGTDGNGVFQLTGQDQHIYNTDKGLRSNHCYGMIIDPFNRLWVTHRGAISRIDLSKKSIQVIEPSEADNLLFAYNAIDANTYGQIFFGSDQGIIEYDLGKDVVDEVEPLLQLRSLLINDSLYHQGPIDLKHGSYQIQLEVIAVSLKNPEGVIYQYLLEGYDNDWSQPTTNRKIAYNRLGYGNYILRVRAFNAEGFGGSTELSIPINIAIPIWRSWWFLIAAFASLVALILLIIKTRERNLRQNQINLQRALDARTKEVVRQKELLEISNKDITDSIKYAKNIQQAMLPSHETLDKYFNDTFIYFKPRDIVSGDFYTVEKFENMVVVSCADCTGHGVPGAFMSLIGSTILKEVTTDKTVQNASQVLVKLDSRLREMLNKHGATSVSDGMDISIFDYDTSTRRLRLASANRSSYLLHKGEWIEIKGDRRNVGGSELANKSDYTLHEYTIEPGDIIYLFSDGITDQFGGTLGKKIKKSGLLEWLQATHHAPMKDQREYIKQQFKSWKQDHEQTDDVIVMGIRF